MAVYVGEIFRCTPNDNWPYRKACHLLADTEEELHRFASELGLKRRWAQFSSIVPHYDLTASKRVKAIGLGAVALDRREEGKIVRRLREDTSTVMKQYEQKEGHDA